MVQGSQLMLNRHLVSAGALLKRLWTKVACDTPRLLVIESFVVVGLVACGRATFRAERNLCRKLRQHEMELEELGSDPIYSLAGHGH